MSAGGVSFAIDGTRRPADIYETLEPFYADFPKLKYMDELPCRETL
jgi:hypothetical protein